MLLPGVACPGEWPTRYLCRAGDESARLDVLFRDDVRSNRISFRQTTPCGWLEDLSRMSAPGERAYVMTAMDAETYGHHIKDWERDFLAAVYARIAKPQARRESDQPHDVAMIQPSELFDLFPAGPVVEPHASSWSTMPEDLADGNPYPLWAAPGNETHAMQWEFCDHAIAMAAVAAAHAGRSTEAQRFAQLANEVLQPALHSCQFWWASRRPHFDVPMIHPGFAMLDKALRYAARGIQAGEAPPAVKREAGWRIAAANDLRARFERVLFLGQDA